MARECFVLFRSSDTFILAPKTDFPIDTPALTQTQTQCKAETNDPAMYIIIIIILFFYFIFYLPGFWPMFAYFSECVPSFLKL